MKEETNHILGQFQLKNISYSKKIYQRNVMTTTLWKHCPTIRSWDKKNDETIIQVEEIQRNQDQKMLTITQAHELPRNTSYMTRLKWKVKLWIFKLNHQFLDSKHISCNRSWYIWWSILPSKKLGFPKLLTMK